MEPLADIVAKLLATTAMQAAAPRVGEKLKAMTAAAANGAKGISGSFQELFSELAGIPADLKHRLQNQWQRVDAAASIGPMSGLWDDMKSVASGIVEKTKAAAAAISPATADYLHQTAVAATKPAGTGTRLQEVQQASQSAMPAVEPYKPHPNQFVEQSYQDLKARGVHPSQEQTRASVERENAWVDMTPLQRMVSVLELMVQRGIVTEAEAAQQPLPRVLADAVAATVPENVSEQPQAHQEAPAPDWFSRLWKKGDDGHWQPTTAEEREQATREPQGPQGRDPSWQPSPARKQPPAPTQRVPLPLPSAPQQSVNPSPEQSGGTGRGNLFGMLASLFTGGKAATGTIAAGIGRAAMAAAPTVAGTAGGLASPAVGAAAAGLAATGPTGAATAVAAAVAVALAALPKLLKEFGTGLVESNRELANYNAEIASAYSQFDQAAFFRKLDLADATSASTSFASSEWTKTLDTLQGEIKLLATAFNIWSVGVATIGRQLPALLSILTAGQIDPKAIDKMQKDIEKMVAMQQPKFDWGEKLTAAFTGQNLPGKNKPKAPLPPIGGGK